MSIEALPNLLTFIEQILHYQTEPLHCKIPRMKVNPYGRAAILTPTQISLLFNEGFVKPRDKALFGVCLYAAARINEACTLLRGDVIGIKGIRSVLVIRSYNTKGKQETREIQIHPQLKEYIIRTLA